VPGSRGNSAVIASIQTTEVIKYLTGLGQLLTNRLLIYDGLNMRFQELKISRDPACNTVEKNQQT